MISEHIQVDVRFGYLKMLPVRFYWSGREYTVRRVTIQFERTDGGKKYLCFGVDVGGMVAELALDKQDLTWKLQQVYES